MKQGWEIKKLGDVCDVIGGGTPSKGNSKFYEGNILWATVRDMKGDFIKDTEHKITEDAVKNSSTNIIPKGNVVIATRVGLGKVCLIENDTAINQDLRGIIPKKMSVVTVGYLFQWLKSISYLIVEEGTGATVQGVKLPFIKDLPIPLPPLHEQQRIVSILDESFAAIAKAKANAEQNLRNAKEVFESYLQGVFENKGDGTKSETLESLCELIVDCEHKTAPTQETGYPSIRTPNIGKGVLILENVNRVSEETYMEWTRRAIPQANDLILAREAPAGNVAVIPENLEVCLGQRTVLIRPIKERLNSKYLASLLLSKNVQEKLLEHSRGATVAHINMKDIRAFKIFNLSSLSEQQTIVHKLDALSSETKKLEAIYQQKINDLEEMKKSILQKAFEGKFKTEKVITV
jgi:type I restriction enzyme S subunit